MISVKLLNLLESNDSIPFISTPVDKCNDLLNKISCDEDLDITKLNPNRYRSVLQCRSKEEKDNFRLGQDVAMTIETLSNFKASKDFHLHPRSIYESSEEIIQRFAYIQDIIYSIVFKDQARV